MINNKTIMDIEAVVVNNQFLKDLFKVCKFFDANIQKFNHYSR